MSESETGDILAVDTGLLAAELQGSISTENDTDLDIEEMSSIADEEAPMPTSQDTSASKTVKEAVPAAATAPKESDKKTSTSTQLSTKPVEPPKDPIEPKIPPKPAEPLKPVQVEDYKPPSFTEMKEKSLSERSEKLSLMSLNADLLSGDKTPINTPRSTTKSTSSSKRTTEKSQKEEGRESDVSEKTLTPSNKTLSKSRKAESSRSSSNSKRDNTKSKRSQPDRKTSGGTKDYRVTKQSLQVPKTRSSKSIPSSTLRTDYTSLTPSSTKHPCPKSGKMTSTCTTFARAETTPSWHPDEEQENLDSNTEICESASITSGLQSLRDIFFDEADSHRAYLNSCYWSHKHTDDDIEKMSTPSYNSHVKVNPKYISDSDQDTSVKAQKISLVTDKSVSKSIDKNTQPSEKSSDEKIKDQPQSKVGRNSPIARYDVPDYSSEVVTAPVRNKKVDFVAGSEVASISLEHPVDDHIMHHLADQDTDDDQISIASENMIRSIDRKYISFTPNTLLCDISNIIPNHSNLVKVMGRHILNKEVCLEFMCWLENLNDMFMSQSYTAALDVFQRQESRFKIVLYECLKVAQGCGLDIGFERVAAMAHISFDVIYCMLPYCDGVKWYSQMIAGARTHGNRLAEAFMLLCMGQLMVYNGDYFEAQRHLKVALVIVKLEFVEEEELYNCIKHMFGFSVALCDCNKISERECGLIKMTEALVMTRNLYGSNSLETALGRLHIGVAYKSLYEDTALRLEGLDYVERAHEVLEDQLGHHPYMGMCVQTLGQYHDTMLNINFNVEYNQAAKCYKLAYDIQRQALGGHRFTVRALTQMGDFYHRMADYRQTRNYLEEAHHMATEHCPTDIVAAVAAYNLGLLYMDEECPEHDIYRGQTLFTSAANLLSKYGVTYQRASILQQMSIASEEAGLKHTFYRQECDNIKSVMFGTQAPISATGRLGRY